MAIRAVVPVITVMIAFIHLSTAAPLPIEKKILVVPGDIKTPYEIIDGIAFTKTVEHEISLLGSDVDKSYNMAIQSATADLEKVARQVGADAVINLNLQFVVLPGPKGNINVLLVYGTVVKYKPEK
jgi:uncharacterized protein YbjQ (UPF0145 family)